jgi:hydrogenase nickel incorporation protein HypA/HybF
MHEMSIAIEVYRQSREAVASYGRGRINAVHLAVGELSAVEPDLISFAWEAVIAETDDAGAELVVRWCPTSQLCQQCGTVEERAEGSWLRLCPTCSSPLQLNGGNELDIEHIEYVTDDDTTGGEG